jgi:hypothetical protein
MVEATPTRAATAGPATIESMTGRLKLPNSPQQESQIEGFLEREGE